MTPQQQSDMVRHLRQLADLVEAIAQPVEAAPSGFKGRRLLSRADAATYLGIGTHRLMTLVREREFEQVPIGSRYYFDVQDLDAYVERVKPVPRPMPITTGPRKRRPSPTRTY